MTRILVTGASGLLGLNLALEACDAGYEVIGVLHQQLLPNAPFKVRQVDLLDQSALPLLLDETAPEWIIHCAALADLDACEQQPELAQQLNAELPGLLAAATAGRGIRFLHISTDAVFDGKSGDYREEDEPHPLNAYARSKLAGEEAVLAANSKALVARVNFFGWSFSGERSLAEFFFNHLSRAERVPGLTDRRFSPLLANDLARLLLSLLEQELSGLYHVASSKSLSKYDFAVSLATVFDFDQNLIDPTQSKDLNYKTPRAADLTLNTDKLRGALSGPLPDVYTGIERFHALYRQGYPQTLKAMASQKAALKS